MIFSTTLEMKDTLVIGRKLPGSVGSSPSRLMTGTRMDLFWASGKTPSKMDRLQLLLGSNMSRWTNRSIHHNLITRQRTQTKAMSQFNYKTMDTDKSYVTV